MYLKVVIKQKKYVNTSKSHRQLVYKISWYPDEEEDRDKLQSFGKIDSNLLTFKKTLIFDVDRSTPKN